MSSVVKHTTKRHRPKTRIVYRDGSRYDGVEWMQRAKNLDYIFCHADNAASGHWSRRSSIICAQ